MLLPFLGLGSRGDGPPAVARGMGLRQAGYAVRIATADAFAELVKAHGLEFASIHGDPRAAVESESGQAWLQSGSSLRKFMRGLRDLLGQEDLRRFLADLVEACRDTAAILFTPLPAAAFSVA